MRLLGLVAGIEEANPLGGKAQGLTGLKRDRDVEAIGGKNGKRAGRPGRFHHDLSVAVLVGNQVDGHRGFLSLVPSSGCAAGGQRTLRGHQALAGAFSCAARRLRAAVPAFSSSC